MLRYVWRFTLVIAGVLLLAVPGVAQDDEDDDSPCEMQRTIRARACYDLAYGDHDRQSLDLYLPFDSTEQPDTLVLMIHGGGFSTGSKSTDQMVEYAEFFAQHGQAAASMDYRLRPGHPFPAQLEDVYCALGYLYTSGDDLGYTPRHVFVFGQSAGGMLASLVGTNDNTDDYTAGCDHGLPEDKPVSGVISFFAPSDVTSTGLDARQALIPSLLDSPDSELRRFSPLYQVDSDDVPFLLVHGDADEVVPISESRRFDEALSEAGVPGDFLTIEGGGHNIRDWPREEYFRALADVLRFMQDFGEGEGVPL